MNKQKTTMDPMTKFTRAFEKLYIEQVHELLVKLNNTEGMFHEQTGKLNIEECMKHVSLTTKKNKKQSKKEETQSKKMSIADMRLECKRLGLTNIPKKKVDIQKTIEDEMKRREAKEEELEEEPENDECEEPEPEPEPEPET